MKAKAKENEKDIINKKKIQRRNLEKEKEKVKEKEKEILKQR